MMSDLRFQWWSCVMATESTHQRERWVLYVFPTWSLSVANMWLLDVGGYTNNSSYAITYHPSPAIQARNSSLSAGVLDKATSDTIATRIARVCSG